MLISETLDIQAVRNNALNSGPVHPGPDETVNGKGQNICIHTTDKLLPHNESAVIVEDEIVPSLKVPTKWQPSEAFFEFLHPQKTANRAAEAPLDDSNNPVIPGLEQLFSPQLSDRDWQKQLAILQARNASVGGIPFSEFNRINVFNAVDLPKSYRVIRAADKEAPAEKGLMTVFYGTLETSYVSWLYPGDTLVGRRARISIGDRTVSPSLPLTSVITPGPCWRSASNGFYTSIRKVPMPGGNERREIRDETQNYLSTSMADPVIRSYGGNVIGVEIHCELPWRHKSYLCGIHAHGIGERLSLCDNKIINYNMVGIGVYDAPTTIASNNTLTAYAAGDLHRAVVVKKYSDKITDNNEVSVMPGGENRPSESHPELSRGPTEVYIPGLGHGTFTLL